MEPTKTYRWSWRRPGMCEYLHTYIRVVCVCVCVYARTHARTSVCVIDVVRHKHTQVTLLKHGIIVRDQRDIMFRDLGDRVAMLLRVQLPPAVEPGRQEVGSERVGVETPDGMMMKNYLKWGGESAEMAGPSREAVAYTHWKRPTNLRGIKECREGQHKRTN